MKTLNKLLLTAVFGMLTVGGTAAQSVADSVMTFKFVSGRDMFYIPYAGNSVELNRLYDMVERYRGEITSGSMPVYVDGYCISMPTESENLKTARIRSNRVKSELITQKGLVESNFVTRNHSEKYNDRKDIVVVTLRIPAVAEAKIKEEVKNIQSERQPEQETVVKSEAEPAYSPAEPVEKTASPYRFAIRTNLLYDAFAVPTLGLEWRINRSVGIKVDGSYSFWGNEHGKTQKAWVVSPEVRWYLLKDKRFYTGLAGNVGEYNVYGYPVSKLRSKHTGYQGKLWNAGLSVGYQLYLSHSFSFDFNLGLGYTRFDYDSFEIIDKTRVYKERDKSKDFWGPTQAGISLIWTIGCGK